MFCVKEADLGHDGLCGMLCPSVFSTGDVRPHSTGPWAALPVLFGHDSAMDAALQTPSGVRDSTTGLNAAKPWHTLSVQFNTAP